MGLVKSFSEGLDVISRESCKYNSQIGELIITKEAKMIANYILYRLCRSDFPSTVSVTYSDVSDAIINKYKCYIKNNHLSPNKNRNIYASKKTIGKYAEELNSFSAEFNIPFVTGKIVAKDSYGCELPEDGFFVSLSKYDNIYSYNLRKENVKKLSKKEKRQILDDINEKIADNLELILSKFKMLNDSNFYLEYDNHEKDLSTSDILEIENTPDIFIENIEKDVYTETEKEVICKMRIGHSQLKQNKLKNTSCCELCGIKTKELLIASHIKPWAKSDDKEKLDIENILLLCTLHDALFDKGLITFDKNTGMIRISKQLNEEEQALLNIHEESKITVLSIKKSKYLEYHNKYIFKNNKI